MSRQSRKETIGAKLGEDNQTPGKAGPPPGVGAKGDCQRGFGEETGGERGRVADDKHGGGLSLHWRRVRGRDKGELSVRGVEVGKCSDGMGEQGFYKVREEKDRKGLGIDDDDKRFFHSLTPRL